jgi:tRNA-(ms[2]io[6]A)-hydroxylase
VSGASPTNDDVIRELPLLRRTPSSWAEIAADHLPTFLADHGVCEQQAALTALNLVAHYPDDDELARRMTALAAEEVLHLRRVLQLLHCRGLRLARRRPNPYVNGLHSMMKTRQEPDRKTDRLLVGALIEARSCERFTCLLAVLEGRDPEVAALLRDLGPAEKRHWQMFYALAERDNAGEALQARWRAWLEWESDLISGLGSGPTVHG